MKVWISAAELSSDQHAALVARAMLELRPQIQLMGIGGPALRAIPGFKAFEKAESLRVMGFSEVFWKLKHLRAVLNRMLGHIAAEKPDFILTLDYPDFHLRMMKAISTQNLAPQALKVCGIPPKVWVWRSRRVEQIRKWYDGVWSIFPFEKTYYQARGIPVIEEGNPLLWKLEQSARELASKQSAEPVANDREVIAVMPGSREAEWKHHVPLIPDTLRQLSIRLNRPILALVPTPAGLPESELPDSLRSVLQSFDRVEFQFLPGGTVQALTRARVGLIKSGTSTLEAVVLGCAPVIFYRMSAFSEKFFEWVMRYSGPVGLPNLLLGIKKRGLSVFPELLGREATPAALAVELEKMVRERGSQSMESAIQRVRASMHSEGAVPQRIASALFLWVERRPQAVAMPRFRLTTALGSLVWSIVNWSRRRIYPWIKTPKTFSVPSILVGNLQAGGAGKTPLVIELAQEAVRRGHRVAVISRGYRRTHAESPIEIAFPDDPFVLASRFGDEPVEIRSRVPEVTVAVGANRPEVVEQLLQRAADRRQVPTLLIFDDGFQNLGFRPSFTILVRTALGPAQALHRDFGSEARFADLVLENPGPALQWEPEFLPQHPIWLVCGLAHPERIQSEYASRGVLIEKLLVFSDHHPYSESEVRGILDQAEATHRKVYVTEKDAVKWKPLGVMDRVGVLRARLQDRSWMNEVFDRLRL